MHKQSALMYGLRNGSRVESVPFVPCKIEANDFFIVAGPVMLFLETTVVVGARTDQGNSFLEAMAATRFQEETTKKKGKILKPKRV